nr:protein YgfX [Pseudomonas insulae]
MLLAAYLALQALAWVALLAAQVPIWLAVLGVALCLTHAAWTLPRQVLLRDSGQFRGLRHDGAGWQLWRPRDGWQAVQLRPDSLALPWLVVLRFRLRDERRVRSLCIPRDALPVDSHRRLRVRLKFSRQRWSAPW